MRRGDNNRRDFMKKMKIKISLVIIVIFSVIAVILRFNLYPQIKAKPNIILIILDTLRADHLGCYGYKRDTSPYIDKLSEEGALFSCAFSQGGYTLASIPSILTSKFPLSWGWPTDEYRLSEDEITLAEILKKHGYITAAFTGGGFTSYLYGYAQGFDLYEDNDLGSTGNVKQVVFNWLEQNKKRPFFLFLHTYAIHDPFDPPEPFNGIYAPQYQGHLKDMSLDASLFDRIDRENSEDIDYIISQYDSEIRYCDSLIGELLKEIEELGLDSSTIIVLTADHGEDLMEHNTISHADIYDTGIHVPLILRYPPLIPKNKRVDSLVRSVDILPTILDILGISTENSGEGLSLLPLIFDLKKQTERLVFSMGFNTKEGLKKRVSLRNKDWKLIYTVEENSYELYNINDDPKELNNVVSTEKDQFKILKETLNDYLGQFELDRKKDEDNIILDKETKQELKSLGYIN